MMSENDHHQKEAVQALLEQFSTESNELLFACRSQDASSTGISANAAQLRRHLKNILDTVKNLFLSVGEQSSIENIHQVKAAAVELKEVVIKFIAIDVAQRTDEDFEIVESVLFELVACIKYFVPFQDDHAFLHRDSIASRSNSVVAALARPNFNSTNNNNNNSNNTGSSNNNNKIENDATKVQQDVATFVQKCMNLISYSRNPPLDETTLLNYAFEIMKSVSEICSIDELEKSGIRNAAVEFVTLARRIQNGKAMEDPNFNSNINSIVLSLATQVKSAVSSYINSRVPGGIAQPQKKAPASPPVTTKKITELQRQPSTIVKLSELSDPSNIKQPLGFAHDLPTRKQKRKSLIVGGVADIAAAKVPPPTVPIPVPDVKPTTEEAPLR